MKIITKEEIGNIIKDGDMVAISGSGGSGSCETILKGINQSFKKSGHPANLGVTCGISPGNLTEEEVGMNYLALPGLVKKAICAHLGMGKLFGKAVGNNEFATFAVPLGVINHLYRAQAGGEPGIITHIGLNTFADPRLGGCRVNELAKKEEDLVSLITIENKTYLFYKTFPINVAIVKGSIADSDGNISLEEEGVIGEQYNMAIAAHNSGGIVIAEVKRIVPKGTLKARNVLIHSSYVDYVVITEKEDLGEYNLPVYRPEVTGDKKIPLASIAPAKLDERKVCSRRAALELTKNAVINLGVGMPDGVSKVAAEENISESIFLSVESGPTGGVPIGGVTFGASINPDSVISTAEQFDAYNGGSLDMAIVGLAEVDKEGNVNVSAFGPRITGPGGFINITQSTKKVIFMGTFMAKDFELKIHDGKLQIIKEGLKEKFVDQVEQITFSAKEALKNKQEVLYITERAVFKLTNDGLELIEIAPGINLQNDILNHMAFPVNVSSNLKLMDERIFKDEKMNLTL